MRAAGAPATNPWPRSIASVERIPVDLSGVPETLLWNLGRRAAAAREHFVLDDPRAIELVDRLDHDFSGASRGAHWHALRVATFDAAVRRFLTRHPAGTVVALGEGLETQFWRVDNGRVRWLTVDLPETLGLRRRLLPSGPRQREWSGSALETGWLDELGRGEPVLVTAQGLLMYFRREQVHQLISTIADRLADATVVFDVVPEAMLTMVQRLPDREGGRASELWSWAFGVKDRAALAAVPGVGGVRDLAPPFSVGVAPVVLGAIRRLPRRVRYSLPVFPILELTLRGDA